MSSYIDKIKNPKTGKKQSVLCIDDYFGKHRYGFAFRKDGKEINFSDGFNSNDFDIFTEEDILHNKNIILGKKAKTIDLIKDFNHISIIDLEDILEYLEDNNLLSQDGKDFRKEFWEEYIKE